eukprot:3552896-Lingulodinium_polyedra.AAC.1
MSASLVTPIEFLRLEHFEDLAVKKAKAIWVLLGSKLKAGRGRTIYKSVEKNNGVLAWRRLVDEYEADESSRYNAMLAGLLTPDFKGELEKDKSKNFMTVLLAWENAVEKYTQQSKQPFPDNMKISVVTRFAPEEIKQVIRLGSASLAGKFENLKLVIRNFVLSGENYDAQGMPTDGGSVPMDVGVIAGKSSGKGKPWGKDKGKQDKGKGKHDKGKGKYDKGRSK